MGEWVAHRTFNQETEHCVPRKAAAVWLALGTNTTYVYVTKLLGWVRPQNDLSLYNITTLLGLGTETTWLCFCNKTTLIGFIKYGGLG